MRFHVGIIDITAAVVVLVAILLPERSSNVSYAYEPEPERIRNIALEQARLAAEPGNSEAADRLARLLIDVGQTDWAIQVAGDATKYADTISWRTLLAVSTGHAERIEVVDAHRYARLALDACLAAGPARCPAHERVRISLYFDQLDVGMKSGIDPRVDPRGYHQAVLAAMRIIRLRGAPPADEPGADGAGGAAPGSSDGQEDGSQ